MAMLFLLLADDPATRADLARGMASVDPPARVVVLDAPSETTGQDPDLLVVAARQSGTARRWIAELRASGIRAPILAAVDGADGEGQRSALDAGADDLLCIPFATAELHTRLHRLTARRGDELGDQLQAALDLIPLPMVISTVQEGRVLLANQRMTDLFGLDMGDLGHYRTPQFYADPAERERVVAALRRDEVIQSAEMHLRRLDGTDVCALVSIRLIRIAGEPAIMVVFHDITGRKRMELALEESERQFRRIADVMPAMLYLTDAEGRCIFSNQTKLDHAGRSRERMLGFQWLDTVHAQDRKNFTDTLTRALRECRSFECEYRARRADGSFGWILGRAVPRIGPDGRCTGMLGICIDIDDRKRAEDELRRSQERIRLIADNVPAPIAHIDAEDRIIYVNAAFARRFDSLPEWMIGQRMADLLGPEATRVLKPWQDRALSGERVTFEGNVPYGALGERYVRISYVPHRGADERVAGYFGLVHDITDLKAVENGLRAAKEAAERANIAKSHFLAAASHDLRQPLNAMSLLLGIMQPRLRDERSIEVAAQMRHSLDAMIELFNALLDISKLDMGAVEVQRGPLAIATLLEKLRTDFEPTARAKGLRLRIVTSGAVVESDAALLERILRNLVANAVRYTAEGGVLVGCRRRGSRLRIDVHDTGPGIPPESLDDIFEEFHQLGNSARLRHEGHGLGLAIVRRAADLLGHRLDVRSTPGRGSRFSIEIPCLDRPPSGPRALAPTPEHAPVAQGCTLLVVEDDPLIVAAISLFAQDMGCRTTIAGSADEALSVSKTMADPPDLILSDFRLPGNTDGIDVIRILRNHFRRSIPACIMTGDLDPAIGKRAGAIGAACLHKPIRPEALRIFLKDASIGCYPPDKRSGAAMRTDQTALSGC